MSTSIVIPSIPTDRRASLSKATATSSSSSSTYSSSPGTPETAKSTPATPSTSGKQTTAHVRRPSLLSSAILKEDYTVINIGDPEGPPRLISYLNSSQGFTWNPEMFIPSYIDHEYVPLENRQEPVHEIRLSDEEISEIYPQ